MNKINSLVVVIIINIMYISSSYGNTPILKECLFDGSAEEFVRKYDQIVWLRRMGGKYSYHSNGKKIMEKLYVECIKNVKGYLNKECEVSLHPSVYKYEINGDSPKPLKFPQFYGVAVENSRLKFSPSDCLNTIGYEELKKIVEKVDQENDTELTKLVKALDFKHAHELIDNRKVSKDNPRNGHALNLAIWHKDFKLAHKLIDYGVNVNFVYNGWSALSLASYHEQIDLVEKLIKKNARQDNLKGQTALSRSVLNSNYEIYKILKENGGDVKKLVLEKYNLLHFAFLVQKKSIFQYSKSLETKKIAEDLLKEGLDINLLADGMNNLSSILYSKDYEMLDFLLSNNANLKSVKPSFFSKVDPPLHIQKKLWSKGIYPKAFEENRALYKSYTNFSNEDLKLALSILFHDNEKIDQMNVKLLTEGNSKLLLDEIKRDYSKYSTIIEKYFKVANIFKRFPHEKKYAFCPYSTSLVVGNYRMFNYIENIREKNENSCNIVENHISFDVACSAQTYKKIKSIDVKKNLKDRFLNKCLRLYSRDTRFYSERLKYDVSLLIQSMKGTGFRYQDLTAVDYALKKRDIERFKFHLEELSFISKGMAENIRTSINTAKRSNGKIESPEELRFFQLAQEEYDEFLAKFKESKYFKEYKFSESSKNVLEVFSFFRSIPSRSEVVVDSCKIDAYSGMYSGKAHPRLKELSIIGLKKSSSYSFLQDAKHYHHVCEGKILRHTYVYSSSKEELVERPLLGVSNKNISYTPFDRTNLKPKVIGEREIKIILKNLGYTSNELKRMYYYNGEPGFFEKYCKYYGSDNLEEFDCRGLNRSFFIFKNKYVYLSKKRHPYDTPSARLMGVIKYKNEDFFVIQKSRDDSSGDATLHPMKGDSKYKVKHYKCSVPLYC